jgi:hypothetical protein
MTAKTQRSENFHASMFCIFFFYFFVVCSNSDRKFFYFPIYLASVL